MPSSQRRRSSSEEMNKRLQDVLRTRGNDVCADCPARRPLWVSFLVSPVDREGRAMGVLLCSNCAQYHHFELGKKRTLIKYSKMAHEWSLADVKILEDTGNHFVNSMFEANLTTYDFDKKLILPNEDKETKRRSKFISNKYKKHKYMDDIMFHQKMLELLQKKKKKHHNSEKMHKETHKDKRSHRKDEEKKSSDKTDDWREYDRSTRRNSKEKRESPSFRRVKTDDPAPTETERLGRADSASFSRVQTADPAPMEVAKPGSAKPEEPEQTETEASRAMVRRRRQSIKNLAAMVEADRRGANLVDSSVQSAPVRSRVSSSAATPSRPALQSTWNPGATTIRPDGVNNMSSSMNDASAQSSVYSSFNSSGEKTPNRIRRRLSTKNMRAHLAQASEDASSVTSSGSSKDGSMNESKPRRRTGPVRRRKSLKNILEEAAAEGTITARPPPRGPAGRRQSISSSNLVDRAAITQVVKAEAQPRRQRRRASMAIDSSGRSQEPPRKPGMGRRRSLSNPMLILETAAQAQAQVQAARQETPIRRDMTRRRSLSSSDVMSATPKQAEEANMTALERFKSFKASNNKAETRTGTTENGTTMASISEMVPSVSHPDEATSVKISDMASSISSLGQAMRQAELNNSERSAEATQPVAQASELGNVSISEMASSISMMRKAGKQRSFDASDLSPRGPKRIESFSRPRGLETNASATLATRSTYLNASFPSQKSTRSRRGSITVLPLVHSPSAAPVKSTSKSLKRRKSFGGEEIFGAARKTRVGPTTTTTSPTKSAKPTLDRRQSIANSEMFRATDKTSQVADAAPKTPNRSRRGSLGIQTFSVKDMAAEIVLATSPKSATNKQPKVQSPKRSPKRSPNSTKELIQSLKTPTAAELGYEDPDESAERRMLQMRKEYLRSQAPNPPNRANSNDSLKAAMTDLEAILSVTGLPQRSLSKTSSSGSKVTPQAA